VILGIRPEDLRDAALHPEAPADARITATVSRLESFGPDSYLHFDVGVPLLLADDPRDDDDPEDATDEDATDLPTSAELANRFVARLDERTAIRPGAPVELAVNLERLHVFDPATGEAVGD
jgi:multiple sugar transport system ATP-binding protein